MIQILKFKEFFNGEGEHVKYAGPIGPHGQFKTLQDLFDNMDSVVSKDDRTNIFYTVAHHLEGKRKFDTWQAQDIIPFDIDGIDLEKIDEYPPVVAEALGIDIEKCGVVYTGNGIHILIQVPLWKDKGFIKRAKLGYGQLYDRIVEKCKDVNLPITKDATAWDYGRILRCPFSINVKDKDGKIVTKQSTLINGKMEIQDLEIPLIEADVSLFMPKGSFPSPDKSEILKECRFFNWLEQNPDDVHEPHAYAMLSITGHFEDEQETSERLWSQFSSPSINAKNLNEFTAQALETSGPRTCEGIEDVWHKCSTCPHFKQITSPIQLKAEDFIGTAHCGFTLRSAKGTKIRQYDDLLNFFIQKYNYKVVDTTGAVYGFNGTHYENMAEITIKNFAQQHFTKPVKESERVEFLKAVQSSNIVKLKDFLDDLENTVTEKVNFKNGVLDIATSVLTAHDPKYYFFHCLPYDYDVNAVAPVFTKFLGEVTLKRPELASVILEYMGYIVAGGEYKFAKALILSGSGKNGKSTLVNVIQDLVGADNCSSVSITAMNKSTFLSSELQHKLLNISEEEPPSCFKETGLFKNLTGNNTMQVQKKFQNPFAMRNKAKMILTYNEMPFISDSSTGFRRRLLIVPFDLNLEFQPDDVDSNLSKKLSSELSGIFNLAFEGLKRLESNQDFTDSKVVADAVETVMSEANSALRWFNDCCIVDDYEEHVVSTNEAYSSYKLYMDDEGEKFVLGRRKFAIEIKNYMFRTRKKDCTCKPRIDGVQVRAFSNMVLVAGDGVDF